MKRKLKNKKIKNGKPHLFMIANDTNFVWNLRREVLKALIKSNYKVTLIAEILDFEKEIENIGCQIINVRTGRHGTNPLDDIKLLKKYYSILKNEKPDVVLTNNIKPNVYAGLACRTLKIKYIPNVCGLGTPVENKGKLQKLTIFLYKIGVKDAETIFFQNQENRDFFEAKGMLPRSGKVIVTPGSGVNLETHPLLPWPDGPVHFLFAARIMKEKGIDIFLEAARKFASEEVLFDICGQCDDPKYKSILEKEKSVSYYGLQKDMQPFYKACSCFLYPSNYPEGMSNVLLEAAASGRPIITTDRAGCRETVKDGTSGFLVPINDQKAVIEAVKRILEMTPYKRKKMGTEGREIMKQSFDRKNVVRVFLDAVSQALP